MTKGARYTTEFKAKAVRLLTESRGPYSSETNAIAQVARGLGIAPETLRRWRNQSDVTVTAETKQTAEEAMAELRSLRPRSRGRGRRTRSEGMLHLWGSAFAPAGEERQAIRIEIGNGTSACAINIMLGRSISTASHEVKRNIRFSS